jgi:hypothetical protein
MDPFSNSTFIGPLNTQIPLKQRVAQLSKQLSSIRLNNSDQQTDLDSLFDELNRIKASFDNLANNIKDINSMKTLYTDLVQLKLNFNNKVSRLQHFINGILQSIKNNQVAIQQNALQLIELACLPSGNNHKVCKPQMRSLWVIQEKPNNLHISSAKKLQEKGHLFPSEKSKINWIVCHFRHPNGNLGKNVPLSNWWMALLFENA